MKKIIFIIFMVFLSACVTRADIPPPALVQPVSIKADTAFVARGTVERVDQHRSFVRLRSEGLFFRDTGLRFGEYFVLSGERVVEGQLLAALDTERIEKQIADEEERLQRMRTEQSFETRAIALDIDITRAEYVKMKRNMDINERQMEALDKKRLEIDKKELDLAQLLERQALTLRHSEIYLNELKALLPETKMYAPYDGIITFLARRVPGDYVEPFVPLVFISDETFSFVEFAGDNQGVVGRGHIMRAFYGDEVFGLERIPLTRQEMLFYNMRQMVAPVRLMLTDTSQSLPPPGTFLTLRVYSGIAEDVLYIPANALFYNAEMGHYVYRMENGNKIPVEVEAGINTEVYTEIKYGLREGDEIFVKP
jgi:HlyD family secretion protein